MGYINKDELSNELLEYMEGLGLTEEQVNQIIADALVDINEKNANQDEAIAATQTKTDNNLVTNDKTIVGAINELFQNANNGKELIASAIGEPLSSEDTFSAMSSDINGLLSTFKTNMMNNGITVESGDKFKNLIDKIATMVEEGEGKGIQYITGSLTTSIDGEGYATISVDTGFLPNILIGYVKSTSYSNYIIHSYLVYIPELIPNIVTVFQYQGNNSINPNGRICDNLTITNTKLTMKNVPMYQNYNESKYYAIGVGEEDTTLRDSLASILQEEGVSVTEEDDMASLISKVDTEFNEKNNEISGLETELSSRSIIKTGTLDYTTGKLGEYNNTSLTITHNLGSIPSYIICRTSGTDYLPGGSSVGRGSSGPLCITSTASSYMVGNGNQVTLKITEITETTFKVVTTMPTNGKFSAYVMEWWVMA